MLPIFIADHLIVSVYTFLLLIANMLIHAFVDDLKANLMKTNLIEDQLIHLVQIALTFMIWATFINSGV